MKFINIFLMILKKEHTFLCGARSESVCVMYIPLFLKLSFLHCHFYTVSIFLPVIHIHHRLNSILTVKTRGESWEILVATTL